MVKYAFSIFQNKLIAKVIIVCNVECASNKMNPAVAAEIAGPAAC